MSKVRIGIIGIGNMGSGHGTNIVDGKVKGAELVAACDTDPSKLDRARTLYGEDIKCYSHVDQLLADDDVDAIIVATPHYDHPPLAIKALEAGKHVLIEKPAGVYTKQVKEMNAVAEKSDKVFCIMYNQRTIASHVKIKQLMDEGQLGEIRRINWIVTSWYRPQSYYNSGGWRATWAGEGGGTLINQNPHQLDLVQWLFGMPTKIRGFCGYGKMHDIEVEDDVTAYMEYENGATCVYITSTSDTPGTNRLEVTGDMGKLILENDEITFYKNEISEREFNDTFKGGFGAPEHWVCKIPFKQPEVVQHVAILNDFVKVIQKGGELIAPGEEGIKGLTISNGIHLSSWLDRPVELPLDEDLFYEELQKRIETSTYKKTVEKVVLDTDGTY